jgi:hypothetical protein
MTVTHAQRQGPASPRSRADVEATATAAEYGALSAPALVARERCRCRRLPSRHVPASDRLAAATFTITTFVNAALLFTVEPMFSKMALPMPGGTPGVWNTWMLFFQTALLIGYGYAHVVTTRLAPRTQTTLHLTLLALSLGSLPIAIAAEVRSRHPMRESRR